MSMSWRDDAPCQANPDLFYPERGEPAHDAKMICKHRCAASRRLACLNWALQHGERYGIWGGMSERERRRLGRMSA